MTGPAMSASTMRPGAGGRCARRSWRLSASSPGAGHPVTSSVRACRAGCARTWWAETMRFAPALIAALVLAGCARVYPVPTDVAVPGMPNPEVALQQSMSTVAAEMEKLGQLGPAATATAEPVVPADLQRIVSFQWNGPLDQGVAKLAQSIGYTFTLTTPPGVVPLPVSINVASVPVYQVFRTLGEQAGTKATVQVDPLHHQVEVIYHA